MSNTFRVVIPTADGIQVAGEFPTWLNASLFQQVILTDRNLKCSIESFCNGMWLSEWDWFSPILLHFSPYTFPEMTTTFQHNALDVSYNGWENYETWNVALWINNDEGLYNLARECGSYQDFVEYISEFMTQTPDGVRFDDPAVNAIQLNSDVFDFWFTLSHSTVTYDNAL